LLTGWQRAAGQRGRRPDAVQPLVERLLPFADLSPLGEVDGREVACHAIARFETILNGLTLILHLFEDAVGRDGEGLRHRDDEGVAALSSGWSFTGK